MFKKMASAFHAVAETLTRHKKQILGTMLILSALIGVGLSGGCAPLPPNTGYGVIKDDGSINPASFAQQKKTGQDLADERAAREWARAMQQQAAEEEYYRQQRMMGYGQNGWVPYGNGPYQIDEGSQHRNNMNNLLNAVGAKGQARPLTPNSSGKQIWVLPDGREYQHNPYMNGGYGGVMRIK